MTAPEKQLRQVLRQFIKMVEVLKITFWTLFYPCVANYDRTKFYRGQSLPQSYCGYGKYYSLDERDARKAP
jgi:ABC-type antimicrobial peptide transport system permease subunit